MLEDHDKIIAAVKDRDCSAEKIEISLVVDRFVEGSVYYVEYESRQTPPQDSFYYVLVDSSGQTRLYSDGVEVIKELQVVLDRRRTFLQRLKEFDLIELIAAAIALCVTLAFVGLSISGQQVNKEFSGIFGIIVGYYFGRNVPARG